MWCVIVRSEFPVIIGPFRQEMTAAKWADKWNAEHDNAIEDFAIAERMLTYQEAIKT
jgi:hypothetical protein